MTSFIKASPNIQVFFGNNTNNPGIPIGVGSANPFGGIKELSSVSSAPNAPIPLNNSFLSGAPASGTSWDRAYSLPQNRLAAFLDPRNVVVTSVSSSPKDCASDGFLPLSGTARRSIFQNGEVFTQLFGDEAGDFVDASDLFISPTLA